jgi:RNA polymerase sigma-70 factor, ECF subfamily
VTINTMANDPNLMLHEARAGDAAMLGPLLEQYRHYLALLARVQIGHRLQGKVDEMDLVQEVFLEAHRHFPQFKGTTEGQFIAWLRQILASLLANLLRRYLGTRRRDVRLEQEMTDAIDRSSHALERSLIAPDSSPSQQAAQREQSVVLADALNELPENYREVIVLRHLEGLTFPEIAERMGKSVTSVQKLWLRGLARLRQAVGQSA